MKSQYQSISIRVILDIDRPSVKAIGFIFPNKKAAKSLEEYAVTVDTVEYYTGLDFFPFIPDEAEEYIEGNADFGDW
jgi:endonuclease G